MQSSTTLTFWAFAIARPTVPAWAKAKDKPSYTAEEVGALPNTTKIPENLSDLLEDTEHRVVTDEEKAKWDAKSDFSGSYADLTDKPTIPSVNGLASEDYVDQKVADLVNSAPTTLDTLGEVAEAIQNNADVVEALNSAIGSKANDADLATVAKSGSYADLSDKPIIPSVDGLASEDFVKEEVAKIDVSKQLEDCVKTTEDNKSRITALEEKEDVVVDTELNDTSNNAIANSVVSQEISAIRNEIDAGDSSLDERVTTLEQSGTSEGVYELIEKIVADGTQPNYTFGNLNLNRAIVKVYLPETSKTTEANYITGNIYAAKNTGGTYPVGSYTFGATKDNASNKYAFLSVYQNHGWWESETHEFTTSASYATIKKFAFSLFKYDVSTFPHINQVIVGGYSSQVVPEGFEIELWGVRNNEDLG